MRKLFAILAILFAAAVTLQFYFAAIGVFSNPEDKLFAIHAINGQIVLRLLPVLLILTAALARAGKRAVWSAVIALVLVLLQTVLFILGGVLFGATPENHSEVPLGATILLGFHALVGVAVLGVSVSLVWQGLKLGFPKSAVAAA